MARVGELKIVTGTANPALALRICDHLGCKLSPALVDTFSDGEIRIEMSDNVRGDDVYVVQPTCAPVNHNLMELCLMLDALKRASAGRVTAVVPYFGYARQDRKVVPRVPISAKMVADFITVAGVDRVLTIDLHSGQIQGFFDKPVDNLYAAQILLDYIRRLGDNLIVVSPDAGGTERARAYAKRLGVELTIINKRRENPRSLCSRPAWSGSISLPPVSGRSSRSSWPASRSPPPPSSGSRFSCGRRCCWSRSCSPRSRSLVRRGMPRGGGLGSGRCSSSR